MKRLFSVLKWFTVGVMGLMVMVYTVMLAINWNDQPPSQSALEMAAIVDSRPDVPDEENGFVYLMGLCAPEGKKPGAVGAEYIAKTNAMLAKPGALMDDFMDDTGCGALSIHNKTVDRVFHTCAVTDANCEKALMGNIQAVEGWLQDSQLLFQRYKTLVSFPKWRMALAFDMRIFVITQYSKVMEGQRMLLLRAWMLAEQGETAEAVKLLDADMRFWRTVLASTDLMFNRAIAKSLLSRNFTFGNLVLRRLKGVEIAAAIPASWNDPFAGEELSMKRVIAGEWAFSASVVRAQNDYGDGYATAMGFDNKRTVYDRLSDYFYRQFFKPQATSNEFAEVELRVVRMLDVPFDEFSHAYEAVNALENEFNLFQWYNPAGHIVVGIGLSSFAEYAAWVYDLEGMRRAALLTTKLRLRGIAADEMEANLSSSELRNPYDGTPFSWNPEEYLITFARVNCSKQSESAYLY